jgi:DNA-binding CsgD family transcriptional regulator
MDVGAFLRYPDGKGTQASISRSDTMPKKIDDIWEPDERGDFPRKVGKWRNKAGKIEPRKFKFGRNLNQAKARLARVRELWSFVEQAAAQREQDRAAPINPYSYDPPIHREPIWNGEALGIALELAKGKVQTEVARHDSESDNGYSLKINQLAATFPCVVFVPENKVSFDQGTDQLRQSAEFQLRQAHRAAPNILPQVSESFHEALDAYVASIRKSDLEPTENGTTTTPFGGHKISNVENIKAHQADRPLASIDLDGCQSLLDYWRNRPKTIDKRIEPARTMKQRNCENKISELIRFFRWLHKNRAFSWRKPEDFDELKTRVQKTQGERTSIAGMTKRKCYLPSELAIIAKHATPLERLVLLLALNCGFRGAEQGTLLLDHLFIDKPHPNKRYLTEICKYDVQSDDSFILYRRNKSEIYGEFVLWPQTRQMINWALEQRKSVLQEHQLEYRNLLITKTGQLFYRQTAGGKNRSQIFNNKWRALIARVQKSHSDFPNFPFKTLRITSSDLVRQMADGEVASTFLLHGKPVESDDLLDLYTKRPFAKLFEVLKAMQVEFQGVFDAAPDDLGEQPMQQYTAMEKRERIVELKKQDKTVTQIMEEVGVSRMTVLRTLERLYFKKKK